MSFPKSFVISVNDENETIESHNDEEIVNLVIKDIDEIIIKAVLKGKNLDKIGKVKCLQLRDILTRNLFVDVVLPDIGPLIDVNLRDYYWISDRRNLLTNPEFIRQLNHFWRINGVKYIHDFLSIDRVVERVFACLSKLK